MRLRIFIDGVNHEIDSTDAETLGRWVVEIFGRVEHPTPATLIEVQAWPSYVPNHGRTPSGYSADWIADSRWIGGLGKVSTPRELVDQLNEWLSNYEAGRHD